MVWERNLITAALVAATLFWSKSALSEESSVCMSCHEIADLGKVHVYHGDCVSCHSGADVHLDDPGRGTIAMPGADQCMTCHKQDRKTMHWNFADHNRAGIECRDCHGIHQEKNFQAGKPSLGFKDKTSMACGSCHPGALARFAMPSHHPVREGAMSCISCHDPHGGDQAALSTKTAQCTTCHQNVRGPHMFEHAPVAEDCTICHNPHGSPNRRLLQMAEPMLCLQCHSVAANRHATTGTSVGRITGAALRKCSSCHSQVHGSSHDQHLRY